MSSVGQIYIIGSPRVVKEILNCSSEDEIYKFLCELKDFCLYWKHFVVVGLPSSLKRALMYTSKLKVALHDLETNPEVSFIWYSDNQKQKDECNEEEVLPMFTDANVDELYARKVINNMFSGRIPLFIDRIDSLIEKSQCETCFNNFSCFFSFSLQALRSNNLDLNNTLSQYGFNYQAFLKPIRFYDKSIFLQSAFVQGIILGAKKEDLLSFKKVEILDEFLNDLNGINVSDFRKVCISALRGIVYPSVGDKANRHAFSLDRHFNTPKNIKGVKLEKCDVVAAGVTGSKGSGKSGVMRILIGDKEGKTYLLAFTNKHDFNTSLVKARVNLIS